MKPEFAQEFSQNGFGQASSIVTEYTRSMFTTASSDITTPTTPAMESLAARNPS